MLGAGFGLMQSSARRRYEKLQRSGALRSEWTVVSGSGKRILLLLLALGVVQVVFPALFAVDGKWWLSGGILAGYAVSLYCQFRRRQAEAGRF